MSCRGDAARISAAKTPIISIHCRRDGNGWEMASYRADGELNDGLNMWKLSIAFFLFSYPSLYSEKRLLFDYCTSYFITSRR